MAEEGTLSLKGYGGVVYPSFVYSLVPGGMP
jgi:hypothetical protein